MIRPAVPADLPTPFRVAQASGLFASDELGALREMPNDDFGSGDEDLWRVNTAGDGVRDAADATPEAMTRGTRSPLLIAMHPDHPTSGRGSVLLRHLEDERARGERLLLVETLGTPGFQSVRGSYRRWGSKEARTRNFYDAGSGRAVFRKPLGG